MIASPALALLLAAPVGESVILREIATGVPPESDQPIQLEITPDGRYGLILNRLSANVTVYDMAARETKWAVDLGGTPADFVLVPGAHQVLVALPEEDQLVRIDLAAGQLDATFPTGVEPELVRVTQDGTLAYAFCAAERQLVVTSLVTGLVLSSTKVFEPIANAANELVLTPDGAHVAVSGWAGMQSFDTATWTNWKTGADVRALVATPDSKYWVKRVEEDDEGYLRRRSVKTAAAVSHVLPEDSSYSSGRWLSIDAAGEYAYLNSRRTVQRISIGSGDLTESEELSYLYIAALTPDGESVLVSGFDEEAAVLRFLDAETLASISTSTGFESGGVDAAMQPSGSEGLVLLDWYGPNLLHFNEAGPASSILNVTSSGVGAEGDQPGAITVHPDGQRALTGNVASRNLAWLDLSSAEITDHLPVGTLNPFTITFGPDGNSAIVIANDSAGAGASALVLDGNTGELQAQFALTSYDSRAHYVDATRVILFSPESYPGTDDHVIFLELAGADSVAVRRFQGPILGGGFGAMPVVQTASDWIVVTEETTKWVSVIDPARMSLLHQESLVGSSGLAARPGTDQVAVAMGQAPIRLLEIDGDATQQIGHMDGLWVTGERLAYSPDGRWLYATGVVAHTEDAVLARFDAESRELVETLAFEDNLTHWQISPAGTRLHQVLRQTEGAKSTRLWSVALQPEFGTPLEIEVAAYVDRLSTTFAGDEVFLSHGSLDRLTLARIK